MREHLGVASWVAGKGTVAGIEGLGIPAKQVIRHAEPCGREAVGLVKAKRALQPRQCLRALARPYQDAPAGGIVVRIARIDFERAVDLREREIEAFPEKMELGEHAISARRCRIQRQSLLGERFRAREFFRAEFGPSRNDGLVMRVAQCRIGVGVVGIEIDGTLEELACLVVAVTRIMRECVAAAQNGTRTRRGCWWVLPERAPARRG